MFNRFERGINYAIHCEATTGELKVYNNQGGYIGSGSVDLLPREEVIITNGQGVYKSLRDLPKNWGKSGSRGGFLNHLSAKTLEEALQEKNTARDSVNLKKESEISANLGDTVIAVSWSEY